MKKCPYCVEEIQDAAIKCRYCGSMLKRGALAVEWFRVRRGRRVAGVCAGLGEHFGVSATALRLAFVILTLFGLWGAIIYAVLWIVMPLSPLSHRQPAALPEDGGAERVVVASDRDAEVVRRDS